MAAAPKASPAEAPSKLIPLDGVPQRPPDTAFKLKMEPDGKILFKGKLGESITVERQITNTTADRQCFKVKCTANDLFRETVAVKITFMGKTAPENMKHFFAFYHVKSDKKVYGEKTAREIWTAETKHEGVMRQFCLLELNAEMKGAEKAAEPPKPAEAAAAKPGEKKDEPPKEGEKKPEEKPAEEKK